MADAIAEKTEKIVAENAVKAVAEKAEKITAEKAVKAVRVSKAEKAKSAEKIKRAKKPKSIVTHGKRKEAVARASIKAGTGRIVVNKLELTALNSLFGADVIAEPLQFIEHPNFDISVNVRGGGASGQAQAARTAIARAIVKFTGDKNLEKEMHDYDRSLLVEDSRRVEPKKFKGPKARARFTKSYR